MKNDDDADIKQSLLENKENSTMKTKQTNTSILYKIFGCCLDRASQSRANTGGDQQNDQDYNQIDDVGQFNGFNPSSSLTGTKFQQSAPYQILSFNKNEKDKNKMSNMSGGDYNGYIQFYQEDQTAQNKVKSNKGGSNNQLPNQKNKISNKQESKQINGKAECSKGNTTPKKKSKNQGNQAINYDSSSFNYESGSGYDLSQASNNTNDLRSSSLSTKTHNYDFDISNYNVDQLFLLGKLLQLIVLIKESKHTIDYVNDLLPDDFSSSSSSQSIPQLSNSKAYNNNSNNNNNNNNVSSRPQSYNSRESYQFQGTNSQARNSRFFPNYEFNPDTIKYYRRRQIYFSKYTEGVYVDSKCWPNLVPDCIVQHVARRASQSSRRESIIDVSCGVGQFSIAFSNHINSVIGIETDALRHGMARNNAQVYNVPNYKYSQIERVSFNEGILFYSESSFLDDQFQINANLSDTIFIAVPQKSLQACPLSNSVCTKECKDSGSNRCFYRCNKRKFEGELNSQAEFKYINQSLEKCYNINKPKIAIRNQRVSSIQERKRQIRIHQQIFNELGKFQLLNIVQKFNFNFKVENMKISEDQTLLSLFYAYLISHNFMSQARISYIISRKQYTNSNLSTNTNNNMMVSEIKEEDDSQCRESKQQYDFRRVSSFTIKGSQLKTTKNVNDNNSSSPNNRTNTQNQYNTEDEINSQTDNNLLNNFINSQQADNITWDEESKQENKSSKQSNFGGTESSGSQRQQNMHNIIDFRKTDRTFSNNSNFGRSTINDPHQMRNTKVVYQNKRNNGSLLSSHFKRNPARTMTGQAAHINQNNDENCILNDLDDKEIVSKNFNDNGNGNNIEVAEQDKFYSETDTETESDYEYDDDSSFAKNNLNTSQNTNNQVSFLRKTQRVYESKIEDNSERTRNYGEIKKSQLSNSSQLQDQDQLIVFHFNFFEQNKNDVSFTGNNMNTSFNLMNTSRLIAQEINNESRDVHNSNLNNSIPAMHPNDSQLDGRRTISEQREEEFAFTIQNSQM